MAEQLASLITLNTLILHLNLSGNVLLSPRTPLFEVLEANTTLQRLDLRATWLDEAAGCRLFRALKVNSALQRLDLKGCWTETAVPYWSKCSRLTPH